MTRYLSFQAHCVLTVLIPYRDLLLTKSAVSANFGLPFLAEMAHNFISVAL